MAGRHGGWLRVPALWAATVLLTACGSIGALAPGPAPSTSTDRPTSRSPAVPSSSTPPSASAPPTPPALDVSAPPATVIASADVPVLCYHQIRDWTPADSESAHAYIMPPEKLRAQLDYLAAHGYHPISPDQLLAHLTTGADLPPQPVMLTFDDGDATAVTAALPELTERGFTATFFIMTVVLGNEGYLSIDQLRALDASGMTIGLHTWDHHRVDRYSGDDWATQIQQPTGTLEQILGHPIRYFRLPLRGVEP